MELIIVKFSMVVIFINLFMILIKNIFKLNLVTNRLYCGIFGLSLKPNANRRTALQKFKILGLYNIRRGKDASGVFVNGEIIKGVGTKSEFDNFIEQTLIPFPKENGIMLGHTRQGSAGYKKTIEEAHPFLINEDLVFTHNGTIRNVKKLCDKYRQIESDFTVDSQVLGTILDEFGSDVLEDYVGAAALAYTYKSKPNVLHLYHGESRDYKGGKLIEERPLFYLKTSEGLFYSSLEESLNAIRESEDEIVYILEYNNIYTVENGEFLIDKTIKINREEANVYVYEYTPTTSNSGKRYQTPMTREIGGIGTSSKGVSVRDEQLIRKETLPIKLIEAKDKTGFTYYHRGRYWSYPRTLLQGPVYLKKGGYFGVHDDNCSTLEFFWCGVLLKDKASYVELQKLEGDKVYRNWVRFPAEHNYAMMLSRYSKYPITAIDMESLNVYGFYRSAWYRNGTNCISDNYTPMYASGRNYKIEEGYLIKISPSQRERTLWDTYELASAQLKSLIEGNLFKGVSGGDSQQSPFLLPESRSTTITETNKKEEDELVWWFDVPFVTRNKGLENIGEDEMECMRDFIRLTYRHEMNLTALDTEIEAHIEEMFDKAEKEKCSIIETIDDFVGRELFLSCYDDVLERVKRRMLLQSSFNKQVSQAQINFKEDDNGLFNEEENMTKEETLEEIENSINMMEDLQNISFELMTDEDNDLAQECANHLISSVMNTLSNLEATLDKHGEIDFVKRIRRIRETKSMKDGVL